MIALRVDQRPPETSDGAPATEAPHPLTFARQRTSPSTWQVPVTAYEVVGCRGRRRLVLLVEQCPYCRRSHLHSARIDFVSGTRTAACHNGRYLVLVGTRQGVSR